jgi:hypothetical protein
MLSLILKILAAITLVCTTIISVVKVWSIIKNPIRTNISLFKKIFAIVFMYISPVLILIAITIWEPFNKTFVILFSLGMSTLILSCITYMLGRIMDVITTMIHTESKFNNVINTHTEMHGQQMDVMVEMTDAIKVLVEKKDTKNNA